MYITTTDPKSGFQTCSHMFQPGILTRDLENQEIIHDF